MKKFSAMVLTLVTIFFSGGCANMDLSATSLADRTVDGAVVIYPEDTVLPDGTEVIVRVIDMSRGEGRGEVLGEQTITNPGTVPVPFHIEYRAEDEVLRKRITIDARISTGRTLRYYTASAHPITPGNVKNRHMVEVVPANRGSR